MAVCTRVGRMSGSAGSDRVRPGMSDPGMFNPVGEIVCETPHKFTIKLVYPE